MARIKLIVTGDLEKLALHESLRRFFPPRRDGEEVIWEQPRKLHGATTTQLLQGGSPSGPMLALARAMLDEAGIGKRGDPADLVVVIDDVELGNLGREGVVAQHFRDAINKNLSTYAPGTQDRYRILLREKCSFHLLKPMVESYLFGDPSALIVAGVRARECARLVHPDVEQFETDDPMWLPTCQAENAARKQKNPWWSHECHPKHYLEHLTERGGVFYEETRHGKAALAGLLWEQVPKSEADTSVIRSLFEDISDWFGVSSPLGAGSLHTDLYPRRSVNRANLLLRNL
jgi:hypothetical protein